MEEEAQSRSVGKEQFWPHHLRSSLGARQGASSSPAHYHYQMSGGLLRLLGLDNQPLSAAEEGGLHSSSLQCWQGGVAGTAPCPRPQGFVPRGGTQRPGRACGSPPRDALRRLGLLCDAQNNVLWLEPQARDAWESAGRLPAPPALCQCWGEAAFGHLVAVGLLEVPQQGRSGSHGSCS